MRGTFEEIYAKKIYLRAHPFVMLQSVHYWRVTLTTQRNSGNWNGQFFRLCGGVSVTAEQAREELDRTLKDSTVRTVLRRLEEKGYLAQSLDDRTFIYRPAQSRQKVAGRAVKRIVDWFCEGSVEALLVGMVDSQVLDRSDSQRLATRIAEAQKQAGKSIAADENKREAKR